MPLTYSGYVKFNNKSWIHICQIGTFNNLILKKRPFWCSLNFQARKKHGALCTLSNKFKSLTIYHFSKNLRSVNFFIQIAATIELPDNGDIFEFMKKIAIQQSSIFEKQFQGKNGRLMIVKLILTFFPQNLVLNIRIPQT